MNPWLWSQAGKDGVPEGAQDSPKIRGLLPLSRELIQEVGRT